MSKINKRMIKITTMRIKQKHEAYLYITKCMLLSKSGYKSKL